MTNVSTSAYNNHASWMQARLIFNCVSRCCLCNKTSQGYSFAVIFFFFVINGIQLIGLVSCKGCYEQIKQFVSLTKDHFHQRRYSRHAHLCAVQKNDHTTKKTKAHPSYWLYQDDDGISYCQTAARNQQDMR